MRAAVALVIACSAAMAGVAASPEVQGQVAKPAPPAPSGDCVTIGKPKPGLTYTYTHVQSNGGTTQTSHQWESVTETGSRVKNTGPAGTQIQVNEHAIVDDVAVLSRTSKTGPNGGVIEATSFNPGILSDPAFRACAGRKWVIPAATATFQTQGRTATAKSAGGGLEIISIRERTTVPAGTFDTVHYVRNTQSVDEYWKSTLHGVIVKHIGKINGITVTETLISIK